MPYVKCESRCRLDGAIELLCDELQRIAPYDREGAVVYSITEIAARTLKPTAGWRWKSLKDARACFTEAGEEFGRRLIVPHEDEAIERNGDIPAFVDEP